MNYKNYKDFFVIFLITFPIFDMVMFYNNITTLMRIFIILIFFMLVIIKNKEAYKNVKWLGLFVFVVILYSTLHHFNALNFNSLVPGNFNYSLFNELLQIFKLTIPIIFLYTIYYINLTKKDYFNVFSCWILFITLSIILSNILGISYGSYSDIIVKNSIFTWFFNNLSYDLIATKGFFMYANQVSLIIILLMVVGFFIFIKNPKNYYLLILLSITGLIIGTRISSYGMLFIFIFLIFIYIFGQKFIFKEKIKKEIVIKSLILIILMLIILPFSPATVRKNTYNLTEHNLTYQSKVLLLNDNIEVFEQDINKLEYIETNYQAKQINENFILNSYPYQYDPDFWYQVLHEPYHKRIDYRFLEISMVKRVVEINDNDSDLLFGITNTRIQNIFNIERDFVLQYYAFGILGMILFLGIYFLLFIKIIINIFKKFTYENIAALLIISLYLFISYLSGNIINHLAANIPFLVIISAYVKSSIFGE